MRPTQQSNEPRGHGTGRRFDRASMLWSCLLPALAAILYARVLGLWAYGDDLNHLARSVSAETRWTLFKAASYMFRPLETLVNSANVELIGYRSLWLSHAVSLAGFVISVFLVWRLARVLYPKLPGASQFAALFFLVTPINVMSVSQIDTISQQYATVFSLLLFAWLLRRRARRAPLMHGITALLALLALLSKETSAGVVLALPLAAQIIPDGAPPDRKRFLRRGLSDCGAVLGAFAVYISLRLAGGASFRAPATTSATPAATDTLAMVARNLVQLFGATAYTGSLCEWFPEPRPLRIGVSAALTAGLAGCAVYGLYRLRTNLRGAPCVHPGTHGLRTFTPLLLLIFAAAFPTVFAGRMSELYLYGLSPFYALAIGLCVGAAVRSPPGIRPPPARLRQPARVVLVLVLAWLAWGTHEKLRLASKVSEHSKHFFEITSTWLRAVAAPGERVSLRWRDADRPPRPSYSAYTWADRVLLRGIVLFASRVQSRPVDYFESDDAASAYVAFTADRKLIIERAPPQPPGSTHAR